MILMEKVHAKLCKSFVSKEAEMTELHFDFWQIVLWTCQVFVPSVILVFFVVSLFHDGGPYHIKASPLICSVNQWTGFCMIWTTVMKKLNLHGSNVSIICFCGFWKFMINCPLNTEFYWALPWEHTFKKSIAQTQS